MSVSQSEKHVLLSGMTFDRPGDYALCKLEYMNGRRIKKLLDYQDGCVRILATACMRVDEERMVSVSWDRECTKY